MTKSWTTTDACTACGFEGKNDIHHVFTRKVYPEFQDKAWNKIPMCRTHHREWHDHGNSYMANKFRPVERWLKDNGWFFDPHIKKWRRDGF